MINYLYVLLLAEEKYYVGIAEDIGLIPFQWKMIIFVEKKIESDFLNTIRKRGGNHGKGQE